MMYQEQSDGFNTIFSPLSFYQATMAILVTQCKAKAWEKASILLIFDQLRLSFQTAILCSRIGGLEITLGWVSTNNWRGIFFIVRRVFVKTSSCFYEPADWGWGRNMPVDHTNGDS